LLLDGWSLPIDLREVLTAYNRLRGGERPAVKPERSYRDYITWIKKRDLRAAESFWRRLLAGFKSPTPLPNHQIPTPGDSQYAEQQIQLPQSATARLQRFAQRHELTLNTVVQGAWALLLSSLSRTEDVVFGVVVSGRSAAMAEVESIVGLFINTLPARATITDEAELTVWFKQLQAQQAEISQYEYSPLARVQAWSEVEPGQPLFESIFVFENYPLGSPADGWLKEGGGLRVGSVRSIERSNYPLTVWVIPDRELVLRIGYDKRRFHKEWISQLLQDYQTLLEQISEALWIKDLLPAKKHKTHKSHY
jgi:non-ribosomal peptide synthetase component F